jgi:hypothetical protein
MKANELRIGNHVQFIITKEPMRVLKIQPQSDFLDMIEPIPLTKEWLLKFGLEYDKNEGQIFLQKYIFYIRDDHEEDGWDIYENVNDSFITTVEYVHQLQNLYFALTGTEIEVL